MRIRIKKGDEVVVIAGKDKGRRGTVLQVVDHDRLIVEGINIAKKHQKPTDPSRPEGQGGIIDKAMPLRASNVMIWNPVSKRGDRIGIKYLEDAGGQRKVRCFRSNGEVIDV